MVVPLRFDTAVFGNSIQFYSIQFSVLFHFLVNKCYEAAKQAGKEYFAVQFYGECWVADDGTTYQKHGPSISCWNGVGKGHTNYVYKIEW